MLWLDIMTVQAAQKIPPVVIGPPEKRKYEVRVICYRTMDVQKKMADLYMKVSDLEWHVDDLVHLLCVNLIRHEIVCSIVCMFI